jgi:uncharacterized protein (DUF983 family)
METRERFQAILRQRCPVCLEGPMFSGMFDMYERCPRCGHAFERETGFFQGAMYVSWALGVGLFATIAVLADIFLAPHLGIIPAMAIAAVLYFPTVPALYRYARVIWAHLNIGSLPMP